MASLRAALVVLPPLSVVAVMAARCLCRVMARKLSLLARSQLACLPSSGGPSSFRYLAAVSSPSSDVKGAELLPAVALYSRRTTTGQHAGGVEESEEEEEECVLCLSGIEEGSEVRELRCRHLFHRACLDRWVRARPVSATCPLCRGRLPPSPPWDCCCYGDEEEDEEAVESDSDMMLFMACVHSSSSSWLWPA